ncbi:hypothetical protein HK099_003878 [Clydaea vesicula]|uniref:PNPLA domain-containing protein n=1 Tax=Clydaea vesicula TaxID=447962 RepID=A0AAD5XVZ4_9FUNG|nr:hypothetical protein HK099_003878 [Clydaea vesicula]
MFFSITSLRFILENYSKLIKSSTKPEKLEEELRKEIQDAQSFDEFLDLVSQLDVLLNNEEWRSNPVSNLYDYKLIQQRLEQFHNDINGLEEIKDLLRTGMLRNFAGIHNPKLFSRSFSGTKHLIEKYLDKLVSIMYTIADMPPSVKRNWSLKHKLDFFAELKQTFGQTALILDGGASFGLYHIGVVKVLIENDLLPKIICGASVGALIAALVCIHTDEDLPEIFIPGGISLEAFAQKSAKHGLRRKFTRLLKYGYLLDIKVIEDCVRSNVGDITFEEAYNKTKRVLNITVSSSKKNEIPKVLNHLTAPKVLIWSACCASVAVFGLYSSIDLLAKDKIGNIVPWNSSTISWSDTYYDAERAETRISELFNVNHFITSQASTATNSFVTPLLSTIIPDGLNETGITTKISNLISQEIKHRINQLSYLGVIPKQISSLFESLSGNSSSNVLIQPHIVLKDTMTIFSSPTHSSLDYWTKKGEQSTSRTKLEYTFDEKEQEKVERIEKLSRKKSMENFKGKIKRTGSLV